MKKLADSLNANKISHNVEKTELVILKHKKKKKKNRIPNKTYSQQKKDSIPLIQ